MVLALLCAGFAAGAAAPPQQPHRRLASSVGGGSGAESRMRADLLGSYDPDSPPVMADGGPVQVKLGLNVFKLTHIDLSKSLLEMNAWVRASWTDPRLDWSADYSNLTFATFSTNLESPARVWSPQFELYNGAESISANSNPTREIVYGYPGGSLYWSRPGILRALCAWRGLERFPYDEIECELEFGGWDRSGLQVNYTLAGGEPVELGGGSTATSAFSEYKIVGWTTSTADFFYPCCPNEPWPVVKFKFKCAQHSTPSLVIARCVFDPEHQLALDLDFRISRSTQYYVRALVTPVISLTTLSFAAPFLDPKGGERIGFGITAVLAMMAVNIITSQWLPSELTAAVPLSSHSAATAAAAAAAATAAASPAAAPWLCHMLLTLISYYNIRSLPSIQSATRKSGARISPRSQRCGVSPAYGSPVSSSPSTSCRTSARRAGCSGCIGGCWRVQCAAAAAAVVAAAGAAAAAVSALSLLKHQEQSQPLREPHHHVHCRGVPQRPRQWRRRLFHSRRSRISPSRRRRRRRPPLLLVGRVGRRGRSRCNKGQRRLIGGGPSRSWVPRVQLPQQQQRVITSLRSGRRTWRAMDSSAAIWSWRIGLIVWHSLPCQSATQFSSRACGRAYERMSV